LSSILYQKGGLIHEDSWRQDLPDFNIVDSDNNIRFKISGSWKGPYDNELKLYACPEPYNHHPINTCKMIPSETRQEAIVSTLLDSLVNRQNSS